MESVYQLLWKWITLTTFCFFILMISQNMNTLEINNENTSNSPIEITTYAGFSTYYGGSNFDYGYGIITTSDGSTIIAGETSSSDFPIMNAFDDMGLSTCKSCK